MKADTRLDCAFFQLSPKRTRCELFASAGGVTEKLASGLVKPFLTHLRAAEQQAVRGEGYLIKLDVSDYQNVASWFTKGTLERFVRFVSTPEVLEHIYTVDAQMLQLDQARKFQLALCSQGGNDQISITGSVRDGGRQGTLLKTRNGTEATDASKRELLRAIDIRLMALEQELNMAVSRAAAAGFEIEHMGDLMIFAERFGATRLRDACAKFMALCQKRQEVHYMSNESDLPSLSSSVSRNGSYGDFPLLTGNKCKVSDAEEETRYMTGKDEGSSSVSGGLTSQRSSNLCLPHLAEATNYRASEFSMTVSNLKENEIANATVCSQHDQDAQNFSDFLSVFPVNQQESGSFSSVGFSGVKSNHSKTSEKSSVTENSLVKHDVSSGSNNLAAKAGPDSVKTDSIEFEQLGSDVANQPYADRNRNSVRSPSHRRRSSSPMRRVQIARAGSRRSNSVVIKKSINYFQDGPNKVTDSNRESSSDSDDAESDHGNSNVLESAEKPEPARRLSVQDAIHLFERKQNEARGSGNDGMRKFIKVDSQRLSADSGNSNTTKKVVFRRWKGASEISMEGVAPQQTKIDNQNQNQNAFVPLSRSESHLQASSLDHIVQSSANAMESQKPMGESPQSELGPVANNDQGVEERKATGSTYPAHHIDKSCSLSPNEQTSNKDQDMVPTAVQTNDSNLNMKELMQTAIQISALPVRQGSETAYGVTHVRSRSSGCEPVTSVQLKATKPKGNQDWKQELGEKANELEALFAAHKLRSKSQRLSSQEKMQVNSKVKNIQTEPDNPFTLNVQNRGRKSLGSSWNNGADFDMQVLIDMADSKHVNNHGQGKLVGFHNDEVRGKFYDHYKEIRDAKLRDEQTTKRAEKEAQLKAMQKILEQRKAEMDARNATTKDPTVQNGKKMFSSSDDTSKPNETRKLSSKTMPANSLSSTSSSPRTSLPVKVSSSSNTSSGRRRSQSENPLVRSVPNFTDMRKENTRPSPGRSTSNSSVQGKGSKSRGELKSNGKKFDTREHSSLEVAGSCFVQQLANTKDEKKRQSQAAMRKSVAASLTGEVNGKVSKGAPSEPNVYSKVTKRGSAAPLESKPFLRKGSGIGPGAGPGIAKLKESSVTNDSTENANEGQDDDQDRGETVEKSGDLSQSSITQETTEATAVEEKEYEGDKFTSDDVETSDNRNESETLQNDIQSNGCSAYNSSPHEILSSPTDTDNTHPKDIEKMTLCTEASVTATSSSHRATSLPHELTPTSFSPMSKSPSLHISIASDHLSSSASSAMTGDSPKESPAWNSHLQHPPQMLEAPDNEAARTRKKWGTAQKFVLPTAHQQLNQKDAPKGLKRLLKFGRKSRGSETIATDWISASTTSDGDDDVEETCDLSSRSAIDDPMRRGRIQSKMFLPGQSSFDFGSLSRQQEIDNFPEQGSTPSIDRSIPAPPGNFKLREDHLSGVTMLKAPRSFFSLSSFRSKGSDSKPR